MNYRIILKIEGNSESTINHISCLEGVEVKEFEVMEINFVHLLKEISERYLTTEVPNDFLQLTLPQQIDFLEQHRKQIFNDYSGELLRGDILHDSKEKAILYQKKGFLVKDKIAN